MKVAVFGKQFNKRFLESCKYLFSNLQSWADEIMIFKRLDAFLNSEFNYQPPTDSIFDKPFSKAHKPDILFSLGGDGTFLDAAEFAGRLNIPLAGINTGRLGFLANISELEIEKALENIKLGAYTLEKRSLLKAEVSGRPLTGYPYCLNEVSVQKQSPDTMLTVSVYTNDTFLNSYWADGLIIATPTGSTAYSLSAGGPIMMPDAQSIIIVPIAAHNLTVRPIILPAQQTITLKVKSRRGQFLCSADSRTEILSTKETIIIKKAGFTLSTVLPDGKNFYDTIRNKLMWGIDKRN